jgi:hypothetical protein
MGNSRGLRSLDSFRLPHSSSLLAHKFHLVKDCRGIYAILLLFTLDNDPLCQCRRLLLLVLRAVDNDASSCCFDNGPDLCCPGASDKTIVGNASFVNARPPPPMRNHDQLEPMMIDPSWLCRQQSGRLIVALTGYDAAMALLHSTCSSCCC